MADKLKSTVEPGKSPSSTNLAATPTPGKEGGADPKTTLHAAKPGDVVLASPSKENLAKAVLNAPPGTQDKPGEPKPTLNVPSKDPTASKSTEAVAKTPLNAPPKDDKKDEKKDEKAKSKVG